jgi:4-amino-4-deoxychorismate lyase
MLDAQGNVIECTAANIFARFGDTLITPSLTHCGIAGITRQRIIELANSLKLKTSIETFDLEKLLSADEVIICSSLYGAFQVKIVQVNMNQQHVIKSDALAANIREALRPAINGTA